MQNGLVEFCEDLSVRGGAIDQEDILRWRREPRGRVTEARQQLAFCAANIKDLHPGEMHISV